MTSSPRADTALVAGSSGAVLVVLAHPRRDSLSGQVALLIRDRLAVQGQRVDLLDLYREGFDPRMTSADEPDWARPDKPHPPGIQTHMRRLAAADTVVAVFPVWFGGPPAMLRGWVERTWAYGFAYPRETSALRGKRARWIGLAGSMRRECARDHTEEFVRRQLDIEYASFCGLEDSAVRFIYDTEHRPGVRARVLSAAQAILDDLLAEAAHDQRGPALVVRQARAPAGSLRANRTLRPGRTHHVG